MKKESKRHILSTVAVILAAVAAVTVLFVLHHKQQQEQARQPEESVSQAEDNTIEWNGKRYTYNNNLINILFLGIDHANDIDTSYMPGDAGQADCIMLLSLDKETKEGRILQINRNTMTQIDTYDSTGSAFGTVNAQLATQYAYCIGGSRSCWATEKTVKKLLYNLPISGYFALSVDGIPEINDALGGVTVEMTEEDAAINPAFEAGKELCLKGADAENYVRYRDTNVFNSNEGRMQRQVKYVTALIKNARSHGGSALYNLISPFLDKYIETDLDGDQIDALSSYTYLTDEVAYLPGETVMGEEFEEFHPDEESLQEQIIRTYYKEVN